MIRFLAVSVAILIPSLLPARPIDVNGTAAYLAGLVPPSGSPLHRYTGEAAWQQHAASFNRTWERLDRRQLVQIRNWAASDLGRAHVQRANIYYMFSGPDFLYAHAFFPNASTYVLCGKEDIGNVPDIAALSPAERASSLRNLQNTLNTALNYSYFITKDMRVDLSRSAVRGVTPVILAFMARLGNVVTSVSMVGLDTRGNLGGSAVRGVKITFQRGGGPSQTLYYFDGDLSNSGNPAVLNFCRSRGPGNSLLKSSSYLMHRDSFSKVRSMLLDLSLTLVQDDSGIPIRYFNPQRWIVRFYGTYVGPINLFKEYYQKDLADLYRRSRPKELNFGVGYRFNRTQTTLMVATRK
jgi:hypothetical protein